MLTVTTIFEGQVGLKFESGRLTNTLEPGSYLFWSKRTKVVALDVRPQVMLTGGQEFQCADGAPLRMSVIVSSRITDAKTYFLSSGDAGMDEYSLSLQGYISHGGLGTSSARQTLRYHVQVAMREWAMSRTMEDALQGREEIASALLADIVPLAEPLGLTVDSVQLLEFGFTGNLKAAYTDVLKAELEGKAAMTRARNEASRMRSLMNTARLVRENPGLLELRILTSGQRPRVHFSVGTPAKSEIAESEPSP